MIQLLNFYGLAPHPFGRRTSKEAVHRHSGFDEALSRLQMSVELETIPALVAEPGCGESLLLGELVDQQQAAGWVVPCFSRTMIHPFGLVNILARRLGFVPRRSRGETADAIVTSMMEGKRSHLVIGDEVHALPDATLQELRLLTVVDPDRKSPFLLMVAGQPALHEGLGEPTHYSLDQRITPVARLQPLSAEETRGYVQHRLKAAGIGNKPLFDDGALEAVFDVSGSVPRSINGVATGAMIVAAAGKQRVVSAQNFHDSHVDQGRP